MRGLFPNKFPTNNHLKIGGHNNLDVKNTFQKEMSTPAQWLSVGGILLFFPGTMKKMFFFWGGGQFFCRQEYSQKSNLYFPEGLRVIG